MPAPTSILFRMPRKHLPLRRCRGACFADACAGGQVGRRPSGSIRRAPEPGMPGSPPDPPRSRSRPAMAIVHSRVQARQEGISPGDFPARFDLILGMDSFERRSNCHEVAPGPRAGKDPSVPGLCGRAQERRAGSLLWRGGWLREGLPDDPRCFRSHVVEAVGVACSVGAATLPRPRKVLRRSIRAPTSARSGIHETTRSQNCRERTGRTRPRAAPTFLNLARVTCGTNFRWVGG